MKAQDLKNSILQLAIQGKLVPQDPNDESAEVLYKKIKVEKQNLIKEGKIKKDKPLPEITKEEIPFEVPSSWKWIRLGDCADTYTGNSIPEDIKEHKYKRLNDGYSYIGTKDVGFDGTINYNNGVRIPFTEEKFRYAYENSILICVEGGSAGRKIALLDKKVCFGNKLCSINVINFYNKYLYNFMQSKFFRDSFNDNTSGIIGGVSAKKFKELLFPLPPLEEQKRIVAKIEEFEPLIEQYGKAEAELTELNSTFPSQLRKSILQYAVQGKLVPQSPNDEPAEVLYTKIQTEKQNLIKEGKIKKDKPLPKITEEEIPFEIPKSWKWVRFLSISNSLCAGGDKPKNFTRDKTERNIYPVIANGRINDGVLGYTDTPVIKETSITISGRGTMGFICKRNPNYVPIVRLLVMVPNSNINVDYIKYALEHLVGDGTGSAVQQLTIPMLTPSLIPLPPQEEQHRIVTKVNELLKCCDRLEKAEKEIIEKSVPINNS